MRTSTAPPSFAGVFPEAWAELRAVTEAKLAHLPDAWARALDSLSPAAREAAEAIGITRDPLWVEALDAADALFAAEPGAPVGALARALGAARFDALCGDAEARFAGDPIAFLRTEAASFYRFRATYGAASLEVAPRKATVRYVASGAWLRRADGKPSVAPLAPLGFLDRAVARLSETPRAGRYLGPARRADALAGVELFNLMYEYDLDPE
jgi:hypothetical protein